jgi:serine/threonine-protein kinase ATR
MRWLQLKRSETNLQQKDLSYIERVQRVVSHVPAELLSKRAIDCKEYARALFFLEPYLLKDGKMREAEGISQAYESLQHIYSEIDEPDALEGLFAIMPQTNLTQQTKGHRKAGRWTAAQTWYEIQLAEAPSDVNLQLELLTCLKESGQHGMWRIRMLKENITNRT